MFFFQLTCNNFLRVSSSDGRVDDDVEAGSHLGRDDDAERLQFRMNVLAELAARVPDDVLAHDDPVEVVERKTRNGFN